MSHEAPPRRPIRPASKEAPDAVGQKTDDYLDEQETGSFPASDPHSDWAGPPTWLRAPPARRAVRGAPPPDEAEEAEVAALGASPDDRGGRDNGPTS